MTRPAFRQKRVFLRASHLAHSSLLALGRHTITGMLCAGAEQFHDWSATYRLFAHERINCDALFTPARETVVSRLDDEPLVVMMDDTLIRKRGRTIPGTAWKRDPLGPPFSTNFVWGQRFLQMSAALPDNSVLGRARAIPIDFVHAPSAKKPKKNAPPEVKQTYRKEQALTNLSTVATQRLAKLREDVEGKKIICAVDGGFTNQTLFRNIPDDTVLIGRIRKDARLFAVPIQDKVRRGRPQWYGSDLPTPEEVRQNETYIWTQVEAFAAGKRHQFDIKVLPTVRWVGTANRTTQVIIIRPLAYRLRKGHPLLYRKPAYLLPNLPLDQLLQAYLWRWEIELNFRDEKTVLGVGQAQVRNMASVQSVPALCVAAYAFLLLAGSAPEIVQTHLPRPKWRKPDLTERTTTQQMQALLRSRLWNLAIESNLPHFVIKTSKTRTQVYSKNSMANAICYAIK